MFKDGRRLWKIYRTFGRYGFAELIKSVDPKAPTWMFALAPAGQKDLPRGVRVRLALEELGPVFVKLGQMLSTRRDMLPEDIANELSRLQDAVPPFSGEEAVAQIEQGLGQPVGALFKRFDVVPLASASIAQVHTAVVTMEDGDHEVIVKVLRPDVKAQILDDLSLMEAVARLADKHWSEAKLARPLEVVAEFRRTILDELNLLREAANCSTTRRYFEGSEDLYVPAVYWDYCAPNVLVQERIDGIPISDVDALRAQDTDLKKLSERGVNIFFTQVFRDNFFHADMHGGNIFVSKESPSDPKYIAVDYGIVGSLTEEDQRYLALNMLAFFNQDCRQVAQLHIDSGWVNPNTRIDELENAVRAVCEPIFDKPLGDISFGNFLVQLLDVGRRYEMAVQPQLVLLQKTLLYVEGLGRQLYPQLDLLETAKPILEQWVKDQLGPKAQVEQLKRRMPELPGMVDRLLNQLHKGELPVRLHADDLQQLKPQGHRKIAAAIVAIGGFGLFAAGQIHNEGVLQLGIIIGLIGAWRAMR